MSTTLPNDFDATSTLDQLAMKLSDPVAASALSSLIDQAGLLSFLLRVLDEFLSRGDVIADSIAEALGQAKAIVGESRENRSYDLGEVASHLGKLAVSLSESSPAITELLDSGLFRSDVMQLLATVADAAVDAKERVATGPQKIHGAYSLAKSLKDPNVQRGMSYVVALASALGQRV